MRYYVDTEFYEDGKTIDLISIGIVAEDGRELYACSLDAQLNRCHERDSWMRENVMAQLPPYSDPAWMGRSEIRKAVGAFMGVVEAGPYTDPKPEVWCYYGASDWVAFYQLWGPLLALPKPLPRWFHELKQLCADVGNPALPDKPKGAHSAIVDARWNRDVYNFLQGVAGAAAAKDAVR